MEVKSLCISKKCYPRFLYASRNMPDLQRRCCEAIQKFGILEKCCPSNRSLESVNMHILKTNNEPKFLSSEDIVVRNVDTIKENTISYVKNFGQFLERNEVDNGDISIVLASSSMKSQILTWNRSDHLLIIVATSAKEEKAVRKELTLRDTEIPVAVSSKESLASDISSMLETIAYQPLKTIYEGMHDLLKDRKEIWQKRASATQSTNKLIPDGTETAPKDLTDQDVEKIKGLCEEILALYEISNVPMKSRPKVASDTESIISQEIRQEIFSQCPTIKAVSYQFDKLLVYVEEVNDKSIGTSRADKIGHVLKKHGVTHYAILPMSDQLMLMHVGSLIEAHPDPTQEAHPDPTQEAHPDPTQRPISGTLGCFAEKESDSDTKTCILLSKHVADGCNKVYLIDKGNKTFVATVIQKTTEYAFGSLDIAAAEIQDDVKVENDARKLKDSKGQPHDGKLCGASENEKIVRKGRRVHIWGAKSTPGVGIVTDMTYSIRDMEVSLIQVQDIEDISSTTGQPFAEEGDSGSIVCSDDPDDNHVNALGMLIGLSNQKQIDDKLERKRKYLSLPLKEGVQQLERKTNTRFKLF